MFTNKKRVEVTDQGIQQKICVRRTDEFFWRWETGKHGFLRKYDIQNDTTSTRLFICVYEWLKHNIKLWHLFISINISSAWTGISSEWMYILIDALVTLHYNKYNHKNLNRKAIIHRAADSTTGEKKKSDRDRRRRVFFFVEHAPQTRNKT